MRRHNIIWKVLHANQRERELGAAYELSQIDDKQYLLERTAYQVKNALGFTSVSIYVFEKGATRPEDCLRCVASEGIGAEEMRSQKPFKRNMQTALWIALMNGEPYKVNDVKKHSHRVSGKTADVKQQRAFIDFPVNGSIVIAADKSGRRIGWKITQQDIDKLATFAKNISRNLEIQKKNERIREKNENLREQAEQAIKTTRTVNHDLKTPLTVIMGYTELLQKKLEPESEEARLLGKIMAKARTMKEFLEVVSEQLLGAKQKDWTEVEFSEIAKGISERSDGARILVQSPEIPFLTNRTSLERILQNLVENGIKYNHSEHKQVIVQAREVDGILDILVEDNGIGIPKTIQENGAAIDLWERIFEERYRAPGTEEEGTGIGLATAKQLLQELGGHIKVASSTPGQGTTFEVLLPIVRKSD